MDMRDQSAPLRPPGHIVLGIGWHSIMKPSKRDVVWSDVSRGGGINILDGGDRRENSLGEAVDAHHIVGDRDHAVRGEHTQAFIHLEDELFVATTENGAWNVVGGI